MRDAAHWRALWPALGGCAGPTPPAVDFARRAVLVAAFGYAGTTGHAIAVDSVARRGGATYVYAVRVLPKEDCGAGAMLTYPVVAVAVPLAPGPVVLVTREAARETCG